MASVKKFAIQIGLHFANNVGAQGWREGREWLGLNQRSAMKG